MVTNSRLINIAQLKLDKQNPRIPKSIRESNPTEQQLIEYTRMKVFITH
jgi:hypothetical protein